MKRKHAQRALAFQTLYGHTMTRAENEEQLGLLHDHAACAQGQTEPAREFGWELAQGAWRKEAILTSVIASLSHRPLEEIGRMEEALLRLGLYEIIYRYTPPRVVMSENMLLAAEFGVTPGGKFVNGILDAAARNLALLRAES